MNSNSKYNLVILYLLYWCNFIRAILILYVYCYLCQHIFLECFKLWINSIFYHLLNIFRLVGDSLKIPSQYISLFFHQLYAAPSSRFHTIVVLSFSLKLIFFYFVVIGIHKLLSAVTPDTIAFVT